ncbi:hypothetical protein HDC90_001462 [Pedobacter sp. AK013]|uniref:hypothetical protein n=1 Tax=Pedobacter sp. AK013 TaxID=2723071 RepID=UPI00161CE3DE|nr:hypothetical protein [Pedobacter sp. AK013]MBB6236847.1 hypothetical protein [Pedobacter sp. AK013]
MNKFNILLILIVFIGACSDSYKQHYEDFESFNKTNLRNKSWFPKIIDVTAYNIKSISNFEKLADFGTFSYSNAKYYDLIFKDNKISINFSEFGKNVNKHPRQIPAWFIDVKKADANNFETIKIDRFYITRNKQEKQVYFVLTN